MKKAAFSIPLLLVFLGTGCLFRSVPQPLPPITSPAIVPPTFTSMTVVSSTQDRLEIHINIPLMVEGLTLEARNQFNEELTTNVTHLAATFRAEFTSSTLEEWYEADPPWSLFIDDKLPTSTGRLQSIVLEGYQYTGGAHGLPLTISSMFDLQQGTFIEPSDLFIPGTDFLTQLMTNSRDVLKAREFIGEDPDRIDSGTEPTRENYQTVYATDEGLVVVFSAYQVAPYAAGPQEVLIPWSRLQGVKNGYRPLP